MKRLAVERSVLIHRPRQHVWRAITDSAQLEQWYAPGCPWEIPALQVGATVKFYNTDTDIQLASIEAIEPLHQLTLRWQLDPTNPDLTLLNSFLLEEEEDDNTRVTVSQAGYEALPDGMRQQQLDQDADAYTAIAESLKSYLER